MRQLNCLILIFFSAIGTIHAQDRWHNLSNLDVIERKNNLVVKHRQEDIDKLKIAKLLMVNGELAKAKDQLTKINDETSKITNIKRRYLAMLYFLEGKLEKSILEIDRPEFKSDKYSPEICVLKILAMIASKNYEKKPILEEYKHCANNTFKFTPNDSLWLESFVAINTKNQNEIQKTSPKLLLLYPNHLDAIKIILKYAIYMRYEQEMIDYLHYLPENAYKSNQIRELIGLLYYRVGDTKKALSYIEDIDSPNVENIKGNINLNNKEYALAFGHFKLALKMRPNSKNALERTVPLSWKLKTYEDGLEIIKKLSLNEEFEDERLALDTAFKTKLKMFKKADKQMLILEENFKGHYPYKILFMASYLSLINNNPHKLSILSDKACKLKDGLNCWIQMQQLIWKNISKTISRDDKVYTDKELTLSNLKKPADTNPIDEIIFVDQDDIKELDSSEVRL